MKKVMLIALLTIAIIFVSGCVNGGTDDEFIKTGQGLATPIYYNFYGNLIESALVDGLEGTMVNLKADTEIIKCELESETIDITAKYDSGYLDAYSDISVSELEIGKSYAMQFTKGSETDVWYLNSISENKINYKENVCKPVHADDLKINQLTNIETYNASDPQMAQQIISTVVNINQESELAIELQNYQDNDIIYQILNADIRSEFANDVEEACQVTFDSTENTITGRESSLIPYTTKILTFNVICDDTVEKENTREECDINGDNCQTITTPNKFILWGEIKFTDELNNMHIVPEHRKLKQHIEIE